MEYIRTIHLYPVRSIVDCVERIGEDSTRDTRHIHNGKGTSNQLLGSLLADSSYVRRILAFFVIKIQCESVAGAGGSIRVRCPVQVARQVVTCCGKSTSERVEVTPFIFI